MDSKIAEWNEVGSWKLNGLEQNRLETDHELTKLTRDNTKGLQNYNFKDETAHKLKAFLTTLLSINTSFPIYSLVSQNINTVFPRFYFKTLFDAATIQRWLDFEGGDQRMNAHAYKASIISLFVCIMHVCIHIQVPTLYHVVRFRGQWDFMVWRDFEEIQYATTCTCMQHLITQVSVIFLTIVTASGYMASVITPLWWDT